MLLQNAVVRRVDNALGLLLELPASSGASEGDAASEPAPAAAAAADAKQKGKQTGKGKKGKKPVGGSSAATGGVAPATAAAAREGPSAAGYAHISAVSDERVEKLDKVSCVWMCLYSMCGNVQCSSRYWGHWPPNWLCQPKC